MKTMHATETQLALLQTGELGVIERLRVRFHVNSCERCSNELASFEEARAILESESGHLPGGLDWQRLSAEMSANIHLGVEAGECVRPVRVQSEAPATPFSWQAIWRPGLAIAGLVMVLYAGTWMGANWMAGKKPNTLEAAAAHKADNQVVLEARPDSLQIRSNGAAFSLVRASTASTDISVGTGGSLQARDIDEDTGAVTIYHVYAE
jgi:anti-sigma factor RsiW